jgi:hypothetical protein
VEKPLISVLLTNHQHRGDGCDQGTGMSGAFDVGKRRILCVLDEFVDASAFFD